jgi:myosin heavy subunit
MYDALISSLTKFNMTKAQTTNLFNVVSGILYLGNITFQDIMLNGGEGSEINTQTMSYFQKVVELLGVDSTVRFPLVSFANRFVLSYKAIIYLKLKCVILDFEKCFII